MFLLYSFLYTVAFIALLPVFLIRRDKYAAGFEQRFGTLPDFEQDERPVIWIHCVSVGETNAARPLISKLLKEYPNYRLVVSTTTKTGQELARRLFAKDADLIFYFPYDWRFVVRKVFRKLQPKIVLIMETEIWLNFLRESRRRGIRVFIINGRLSEKSLKKYLWVKKTLKRVLRSVDAALMQTPKDARRLIRLGLNANKVKVTGNFKFDQEKDSGERLMTAYFRERFGLAGESPLIVAASTHEWEEELLLDAFMKVYKSDVPHLPRLMLVPRHPERFREVGGLIERTGFNWTRRTNSLSLDDELADIILLDTIGELRSVYPLADLVFVGGSLIPHGGQNILEPALESKAIVTGHFMTNFAAITEEFVERDAIIKLPALPEEKTVEALAETFENLIRDESRRKKLAKNAYVLMKKNRGATDRTLRYLKPYLQVQSNFVDKMTAVKLQK